MTGAADVGGWRVVAVLAVTETVSWGVLYYAFSVIQVPMGAELGLTPAELGTAFSLAVLATGVTGVAVGRLLDRVGPRAVMTGGSLASAIAVLAWSRVDGVAGLLVVMAAVGAARSAVLYEVAFAVVVGWLGAQRAQAILAITVLGGLASTIALPVTDVLVARLGWRGALVVLGAFLAVVTVLPHWFVLPAGRAGSDGPAQRFTGLRPAVAWAARDPSVRAFALAFCCHASAVVLAVLALVPFLTAHGHAPAVAAVAAGSLGALSVTGRLVLTAVARRRGIGAVTSTLFAVQAVGTLVLVLAPGQALAVVVFVLLFGLGFGVASIAKPILLADAYGTGRYATLAGLVALVTTAGAVTAPMVSGFVQAAAGWSSVPFVLSGLLCLAGALALRRADAVLRRSAKGARDVLEALGHQGEPRPGPTPLTREQTRLDQDLEVVRHRRL